MARRERQTWQDQDTARAERQRAMREAARSSARTSALGAGAQATARRLLKATEKAKFQARTVAVIDIAS